MRKVKVMTDSSAGLPKDIVEKRGIGIIPAHIILGSKSYPDDGSVSTRELFEFAKSAGELPRTEPPSEYEFQEAFQKWLGEDYDIFFIGLSSKLAETVNNALSATVKLAGGRISVVDSLNVSSGAGLLVLEAADLADRGASLQEINVRVHAIRAKVRVSFAVDTLKYLYIGGRVPRLTSIMADTLNIKPTINITDGEMVPGERLSGRHYIDKFVEQFMENPERIDPKRIFVTHCLIADTAEEVKEKLVKDFGFKNVIIADLSSAVSVHGGPGALGITYLYK